MSFPISKVDNDIYIPLFKVVYIAKGIKLWSSVPKGLTDSKRKQGGCHNSQEASPVQTIGSPEVLQIHIITSFLKNCLSATALFNTTLFTKHWILIELKCLCLAYVYNVTYHRQWACIFFVMYQNYPTASELPASCKELPCRAISASI